MIGDPSSPPGGRGTPGGPGGFGGSRDGRLGGVAFGVVSQNKDPEGLGRIRVRLPWLDGNDVDESRWASWAVPFEGKQFGWYTLPDVGDQVVLAFVGGDLRHPVVLGGAWNSADPPPEANDDGKNNFRGYRSRSGHKLVFDDSAKAKVVFVEQSGQHVLGVGALAGAGGNSPNAIDVVRPGGAGDAGVALAAMEGDLQVACPDGTLTLDAGQDLTIRADTTVTIKAGGATSAEGNKVTITSSAGGVYQGSSVEVA